MKTFLKLFLVVSIALGSSASFGATTVVEPTYPGSGEILRASWLYDVLHRLYVGVQGLSTDVVNLQSPILETFTTSAATSTFILTNSFPTGKNRICAYIDGVCQGYASPTATANFTEVSANQITFNDTILAGCRVDFVIFKLPSE